MVKYTPKILKQVVYIATTALARVTVQLHVEQVGVAIRV
jgi:hypothetical protein